MTKVFSKNTRGRKGISLLVQAVGDVWNQMRAGDIQVLAASLAFATVLALVPLLAVSLSVFKAYGGFDKMLRDVEQLILHDVVGVAGAEARRALRHAVGRVHSGALGLWGTLGLLLVSTKLFHDMDTAVHRVWGIRRGRPLWRSLLVYWFAMFVGPVALAAALGALGSKDLGLLGALPRRTIALTFGWLVLFAVLKWVPSRPVKMRPAFWSACAGALAFYGAQEGYALLTKQILAYNKIYGSLASIPIFLIWVLIIWQIILAAVALCASWQLRLDSNESRPTDDRVAQPGSPQTTLLGPQSNH